MPFSKLIQGFGRFHSKYFLEKNKLYETLVHKGQSPEVLMIACSDSRNDPALVTECEPGDIFVVRNVAAIVPPYSPDDKYHGTSAAIEFAVKGLKVKDIVVMGHALCGGVNALLTETHKDKFEFLGNWIEIGNAAKHAVEAGLANAPKEIQQRALEQAVILTSLNNLMTFPWIRDGVAAGKITLHGWYFDLEKGKMLSLDFMTGAFTDMRQSSLMHAFIRKTTHYCDCSVDQVIKNHK
jgi:carbonic anhydrase